MKCSPLSPGSNKSVITQRTFSVTGVRSSSAPGKLSRLTEMLEEVLAEGDRALVFTQYAEMGKLIEWHLRTTLSVDVSFLHGAVPRAERERMITSFQEDDAGPPIFVLSLKAGGFGLNLTQARHVFHFDRWWNPAVEAQATDRAFRIGQTRSVAVYKFICAGTIEERIDELAERKKRIGGCGHSIRRRLVDRAQRREFARALRAAHRGESKAKRSMATTSETGSDKRWWSERWWAVMESIGVARRLEHGKHYARAERVLSLEIEPGLVSADVQGSRYDPYHVEIGVDAFTDDEWHEAVKALASQALFSAKLLAGEMPENIEEAFSGVGLSLFPNSASELTMKCSCPDAFVPCKHIVAIHYVLADKLGADPVLIV